MRPVSVGLLRRFQIAQHARSIARRSRREQRPGSLNQVARPHEVITTKIFISFVEAPGNRKTGDNAAQKILRLMSAQHRCGGAIQIVLPQRLVQRQKFRLPVLPLCDVMRAHVVVVFEETGSHLLARFGPDGSEADCDHEFSVTGGQIDFSRERYVSVLGTRVLPFHRKMLREILPAIRCPHETNRHFFPGRGSRHAHIYSSVLGKERGKALVIANPSSVAVAAVRQVGREQRE